MLNVYASAVQFCVWVATPPPVNMSLLKTWQNHQNLCNFTDYPHIFSWRYVSEMAILSFWRNIRHWLHRKLSFWQLPVRAVTQISWMWHFENDSLLYSRAIWNYELTVSALLILFVLFVTRDGIPYVTKNGIHMFIETKHVQRFRRNLPHHNQWMQIIWFLFSTLAQSAWFCWYVYHNTQWLTN